MQITTLRTDVLGENTYIIHNNNECLLIDPGSDKGPDVQAVKQAIGSNKLVGIICTHNHFDHIGGIHHFDVPIYMHQEDIKTIKDQKVWAELMINTNITIPKTILPTTEQMKIGSFEFSVIHTPGHSKGGVCFLFDTVIFTGDTLFKETYGRTDIPHSSREEIIKSLKLLATLNEELVVYPGHGPYTTIKDEKGWILELK